MNIMKLVTAVALIIGCAPLFAGEKQGVATEKSAGMYEQVLSGQAKTPATSEVLRDVVIGAGKTITFDSSMDYSSATAVAVTVLCAACSTNDTSLATLGLVLQARWMVPNAESFVATEFRAATAFPYWDAGGVMFSVFGSQFRLSMQNKGTQAITLKQVTLFIRN
jgi:hypothetical protein